MKENRHIILIIKYADKNKKFNSISFFPHAHGLEGKILVHS
jgi:hypothetical protein